MGNIDYRIVKNANCVHFEGTGDIGFDYLISRIVDVQKDPEFEFTYNTFIDFENATVSFKAGGLDSYKSFFAKMPKNDHHRKWAITDPTRLHFIA